MKPLLLLFIFIFTLKANELLWVDEQIKAIKPPRDGISKSKINAVKDPFTFIKEVEKKDPSDTSVKSTSKTTKYKPKTSSLKTSRLRLQAIMNKSALINGKWYRIQDKVGKYTLSAISTKKVTLSYKKKSVFLSTNTSNKKIKFKSN